MNWLDRVVGRDNGVANLQITFSDFQSSIFMCALNSASGLIADCGGMTSIGLRQIKEGFNSLSVLNVVSK